MAMDMWPTPSPTCCCVADPAMSVTAILIEPHRVTRVIFDAHDLAVGDLQRIAQAIECSLAQADGEEVGRRAGSAVLARG